MGALLDGPLTGPWDRRAGFLFITTITLDWALITTCRVLGVAQVVYTFSTWGQVYQDTCTRMLLVIPVFRVITTLGTKGHGV